MAIEPKAKNGYSVSPSTWRRLSERERHHFNKMYALMYYNKERYAPVDFDIPYFAWRQICYQACLSSIETMRRGNQAKYIKLV